MIIREICLAPAQKVSFGKLFVSYIWISESSEFLQKANTYLDIAEKYFHVFRFGILNKKFLKLFFFV